MVIPTLSELIGRNDNSLPTSTLYQPIYREPAYSSTKLFKTAESKVLTIKELRYDEVNV